MTIKKLNPDAFKGSREFCTEMVTLGMLLHSNIVKILGYCMTESDWLLTYEFSQNGCLDPVVAAGAERGHTHVILEDPESDCEGCG